MLRSSDAAGAGVQRFCGPTGVMPAVRFLPWLVSLAGAEDKLAQIDTTLQRQEQAVHLGMPAFPEIAGRSVPPAPEGTP